MTSARPVHKLPRDLSDPYSEPRYHYRGFRVDRHTRDWDARPYRGSAGNPDRKVHWEVHRAYTRKGRSPLHVCWFRRDALAWIDAQIDRV